MTTPATPAPAPADPRLAAYTDEALQHTVDTSILRGERRSAQVLLDVLTDPADRLEAADRQIGLMNRLRLVGSQAMYQAAMQVRDGAPRFVDEYHPNGPTA